MLLRDQLIAGLWPDFCSRRTLAARLDCSVDKISEAVKARLLPPPLKIGPMERWSWAEVETLIAAHNGRLGDFAVHQNGDARRVGDIDPFSTGLANVATEKPRN